MVGQALFLLADVELLDVVDQLLLQTVLVVLHAGNLLQAVDDALANLLHTALLKGLNLSHEALYVVYLLCKLLLQSGTFLTAEAHQCPDGLFHGLTCCGPLLVAELFHVGARQHVGHPCQRVHPVLRLRNSRLTRDSLQLTVVVVYQCAVHGSSLYARILLYPEGEVHLAAFYLLRNHLADFHLLLAVERCDARLQIQLLRVERLYFCVNLLTVKGHDSFAIASH